VSGEKVIFGLRESDKSGENSYVDGNKKVVQKSQRQQIMGLKPDHTS